MSFREHIERVVREVPGCASCTLLGFDGISIDTAEGSEKLGDLSAADATVEFTSLLNQMRAATEILRAGQVHELCIRSDGVAAVLRPLTPEYLVAATFGPSANIGKGRYLLRIIAPRLRTELA